MNSTQKVMKKSDDIRDTQDWRLEQRSIDLYVSLRRFWIHCAVSAYARRLRRCHPLNRLTIHKLIQRMNMTQLDFRDNRYKVQPLLDKTTESETRFTSTRLYRHPFTYGKDFMEFTQYTKAGVVGSCAVD